MAVSVPLIPRLFSANITTTRRFGEEAKDHISSISLNSWGPKRWRKDREDSVEGSAPSSGTGVYTLHSSCGTWEQCDGTLRSPRKAFLLFLQVLFRVCISASASAALHRGDPPGPPAPVCDGPELTAAGLCFAAVEDLIRQPGLSNQTKRPPTSPVVRNQTQQVRWSCHVDVLVPKSAHNCPNRPYN